MDFAATDDRDGGEMGSGSALVVLGMHRSGTSAVTGALRLCGAWVGDEAELTGANIENPNGFWERRDVRRICDGLLHAAGADWWKIANFDTAAIPHAILDEQRRAFERVVTALDAHEMWAIKEPRLCLLLPVLHDYLTDAVYVHVVRNPLEVARSLQLRNGFGIAAGIALWEAYNRSALRASENLPRVLISHEALMLRPVETLDTLKKQLAESPVADLIRIDTGQLTRFIDPAFYRRRATEEETESYLTRTQSLLWRRIRDGRVDFDIHDARLPRVTRQHLHDLESAKESLDHYGSAIKYHKDRANESQRRMIRLSSKLTYLDATIEARDKSLEARDKSLRDSEKQVRDLERRIKTLNSENEKHVATIRSRDRTIRNLYNSTSWRITGPFRVLTTRIRWLARNLYRGVVLLYFLVTGQFPRAVRLVLPYYERYVPYAIDKRVPNWVRDYAKAALSAEKASASDDTGGMSSSRLRRQIKEAETLFNGSDLSGALVCWKKLQGRFSDDEAVSGRAKLEISVIDRLCNIKQYREAIRIYSESRMMRTCEDTKIAIYTAIVGNYDSIKLPEIPHCDFDYILFSDTAVPDTGIWKVRPITYFGADATRTARFVKTHPHLLLSDHDVAIWMDSNIMIVDDISGMVREFLASKEAVGCIPHPSRTSIYEEFHSCKNRGKDEAGVMEEQLDKYRREDFSHDDLIESNFLAFDLRSRRLDVFLDKWWREIDRHSKRDQLSINYALARANLGWYAFTKHPDSMRNHDKFAFVPHDEGIGSSAKLVEALEGPLSDPYDGVSYADVREGRICDQESRTIDIIICVHDALVYVQQCLESVLRCRKNERHRVVIVDDGSGVETAEYLRQVASATFNCELYRNDSAQGYVKAANRGLSASTGELVILLNSDTVVTDAWAEKLADAVFSTSGAGIVGPLSNAASYQSIPEYRGTGDQTAVNELPEGWTPERMNGQCERWTRGDCLPRVPLVHGFCFGIRREVIDKIGCFDEDNFPQGYGEENDYCFRATDAGIGLVVATHTYIYHEKSRSYSYERRVKLMKEASRKFREKYGHGRIRRAQDAMADHPILVAFRKRAKHLSPPFNGTNKDVGGVADESGTIGSLTDFDKYDFLDFGASAGGSMKFAKHLGGTCGLGVDRDKRKVEETRRRGYDCIVGDITALDLPENIVKFVTMIHVLEHLPDLDAVGSAVGCAARVATDFLYIAGPWFDADEYLKAFGLKVYWSDWHGHPCHVKTSDLREILDRLGLHDFLIMGRDPIESSADSAIHPLESPRDQHAYDGRTHPKKPDHVSFGGNVYREMVCCVRLRRVPNWDKVVAARRGRIVYGSPGMRGW